MCVIECVLLVCHRAAIHSGSEKDRRKKDADTWWWRWCIDHRWRDIRTFTVTIRTILASTALVGIAVMPAAFVLVTAIVVFPPPVTIIIAEGFRHVHKTEYGGYKKPHHHHLGAYGTEIIAF